MVGADDDVHEFGFIMSDEEVNGERVFERTDVLFETELNGVTFVILLVELGKVVLKTVPLIYHSIINKVSILIFIINLTI